MQQPRGATAGAWSLLVVLALAACGAADEPVDPSDLELRDLLGVTPKVAAAWNGEQREAARQVLAGGLIAHDPEALAMQAAPIDQGTVIGALAVTDDRLLDRGRDALGLVMIDHPGDAATADAIDAPAASAVLLGDPAGATPSIEIDPRAWPCPGDGACDLGVLAALAADAAPGAARVRVLPVTQLAVIAAVLPGDVPTLLVNPIVTAVGEPLVAMDSASPASFTPAWAAPARPRPVEVAPLVTATWAYDPSVGACASSVQAGCATCLGGGACDTIWSSVSGMDACTMLDAQPGQNYSLLCVNLAVSLGDVGACIQRNAPSCAFDTSAILEPAKLRNNTTFVDNATCRNALDACLQELYGASDSGGGCGSCDGCDCGSCDCGNGGDSCSLKDSNMDTNNCNSCNDNSGGCGSCNDSGGGGGCNNSGGGSSCAVAKRPSRGAGVAVGGLWVLLPVPAALRARRRGRKRTGRA